MSCSSCSVVMDIRGQSFRHVPDIPEPILMHENLGQYIETVYVQPGVILYILRIPADNTVDISFDVRGGLVTFECWLKGELEYRYETGDGSTGFDHALHGYIMAGSAGIEKGFVHKPASVAVEMVKLSFEPSVFETILERVYGVKIQEAPDIFSLITDSRNRFARLPLTAAVEAAAKSIAECRHVPPLRSPVIANLANGLLYSIFSDLLLKRGAGSFGVQPGDLEKFYDIKGMIDSNLFEPLSHCQIARKAGINEFKLKNGFKEIFGTTVNGYMTEQRMLKARKMLESGSVSVSEAAWEIGYTNVSHFISVFRRHYGVTPGKFLMDIKLKLGSQCATPSV
ncbi:AraC family transcriptional regulator [Seleniivibrio woodruffii]|uniref:helix-turn-helix transcriptional regulator n=1 Tax=Seleniivibrio woodruffii TaxID=1078050 RepID=UPI0026EC3B3C|nr:AraC family transcriptional regulator [Seleniivibrio woodruffii]